MDVQQLNPAGIGAVPLAIGPRGGGLLAGPAHRRPGSTRAVRLRLHRAPRAVPQSRTAPRSRSRPGRALILTGTVVAALACAAAAAALLAGFRWYVVETPSMGTAAPVGSLVVTAPAPARVGPGTVIAFTPPGPPRTYTHRVVAITADGGIRTKGDINPEPDVWTIRRSAVLGQAAAILPGLGYALRALPALIAGTALLWLVTAPIGRRDRRASARVTGMHLVVTLVVLWLQPFVRIVVITAVSSAAGTRAAIVATGVLPVRLLDGAGEVVARLTAGRPQVVAVPRTGDGGARLLAVADLHWQLQALLIALAVLPALAVLVVGLPRGPRHRT